jgi:DNA-binding CsgD family transcriptional regulator
MNVWTLAEGGSVSDAAQHTLAEVIGRVGSAEFSTQALHDINRTMAVGSWSAYRTFPRTTPVCYLSNSFERRDTTSSCFLAYRQGIYRRDRTFDALDASKPGQRVTVIHLAATDVSNPDHRRAIYEHHALRERLSVAKLGTDGSILSVNLYRHLDQPGYRELDLQLFESMARGLLASVERQIALTHATGDRPAPLPALDASGRRESQLDMYRMHRSALLELVPDLPSRELDVCLRLLRGMSHDGIACDLGISVTTVKTYRNRAFARMDIHHNNELFALVLQTRNMRQCGAIGQND